jgi:hypothetical protein
LGLFFTNCAALFVPDKEGLEIQLTSGMDRYFKVSPDVKAKVVILEKASVAGAADKTGADQ